MTAHTAGLTYDTMREIARSIEKTLVRRYTLLAVLEVENEGGLNDEAIKSAKKENTKLRHKAIEWHERAARLAAEIDPAS